MPFHYICISASSALSQISSVSEILNPWIFFKLLLMGAILVSMTLWKKRLLENLKKISKYFSGKLTSHNDYFAASNDAEKGHFN